MRSIRIQQALTAVAVTVAAGTFSITAAYSEDARPPVTIRLPASQSSAGQILYSNQASPNGIQDLPQSAAAAGWHIPGIDSRSKIQAELFAGMRYSTDANQAADTLNLGQVIVPQTLQRQSDWSFVTRAQLDHQYSLGHSDRDAWETHINFSDQRFLHISHDYDLTVVQADTGPRFSVAHYGDTAITLRPYGSALWIGYGEKDYAYLYGGGVSAQIRSPTWQFEAVSLRRFGNYVDSTFRPGTRAFTGPEWTVNLSASHAIDTKAGLRASVSWYSASSRTTNLDREGPAADIYVIRNLQVLRRTADLVVHGSVQRLRYGGPPSADSTASREDTQWIGGLSLSVPIRYSISAVAEYEYLSNSSNYFPFENHSFTLGIKTSL